MRRFYLLLCIGSFAASLLQAQQKTQVTGTVQDGLGGQSLSGVTLSLVSTSLQTHSDAKGSFSLDDIPSGDYVLQASASGYRPTSTPLHVDPDKRTHLQITLNPASSRRVDTVAVQSGTLFNTTNDDSIGLFSLTHDDVKNLSTVLANDPLRAVQGAPGVTANDDFEARFSVRGTDPNRVGIYLDGVQLHQVVHTIDGLSTSGSNSVFNPDLVDELNLYNGAVPARFSDSSAGALDVRLRDGNPDQYSFRAIANFAYGGLVAEGPAASLEQCSWIAGFRKSYLQYLLQNTLSDSTMSFGFGDEQGRFACRVTPANTVTLDVIVGDTALDLSSRGASLGPNSLMIAKQRFSVANLGWQYVARDNLLFTNHLAFTNDNYLNLNPSQTSLGNGGYNEWVWNSNVAWMWNANSPLALGSSVRFLRESGHLTQVEGPADARVLDRYNGAGTLAGGFVEQAWTAAKGRLHLTAGARWDHHSTDGVTAFSPQAGLTFSPWSSGQLRLSWGQYTQFPQLSQFTSSLGNTALLPVRSLQASVSFEQHIGARTRLRATLYNRQDRDLLNQPFRDPKLIGNSIFHPPANPLYFNSLRGTGRGIELLLQRANLYGLTGWASYAYGVTNVRDGITGDAYPADYDQRHTINVYASYPVRPSVNLSARYTYGSGYPIPAYLRAKEPYSYSWAYVYALGDQRNRLRVGPYQRLDLRVNKTWTRSKWKKTLYAEVTNVTNRANYRFDNFEAYSSDSKIAYITLDRMFPILPSVGFVIER